MMQQPSWQMNSRHELEKALQLLSAREQIGLLVQATRVLPGNERAEVWRVAGFSVLRDRFLPILVHILLKRLLAGALWWVICGIAALSILLVLAVVAQMNAHAVAPVVAALVSFLCGFLLFAVTDFIHSLIQFFRTTCSPRAREELLVRLNACDSASRLVLLRVMSTSVARKVPGESLLDSLITSLLLLLGAALLIILVVLFCSILPAIGSFPWLWFVALVAFLLGLVGPGMLQHRLRVRLASKRT